jgi:hypothetical protein
MKRNPLVKLIQSARDAAEAMVVEGWAETRGSQVCALLADAQDAEAELSRWAGMTTTQACELLVRETEMSGAESFEKNFVRDGKTLCSVFVLVGPHTEEITAMIREKFGHYGFSLHRDEAADAT